MMDIVYNVLGALLIAIGYFIAWSILLKKPINLKNYKIYLLIVILTIILMLNQNVTIKMLKITIITIFFSLFIKMYFKEDIKISIITAFYTQIINTINELIYVILATFVFNVDLGVYSSIVIFFADLYVALFAIIFSKIRFVQTIYNKIIEVIKKMTLKKFVIFIIPICFLFNIYLAITYYKYNFIYYVIINNMSLYLIFTIIFLLLKRENDYLKIYEKYNTTLISLKEYEDILDKYKIYNHENKNQLLTIRNMISSRNTKVINYIDGIVDNQLKDNEKIMQSLSVIPAGGLRGLIYSKILYMEHHKIKYNLNISKNVRTKELINKLDSSDVLDICQIMGVYLDNAIESVIVLKDKILSIDIYVENGFLFFEISNYYKGNIDLNKMDHAGYTTKKHGHGYGLSLAKKIIKDNKKLFNEKKLTNNTFTQILKVSL